MLHSSDMTVSRIDVSPPATALTPQANAVLNHLLDAGSVTAVEAAAVLRVRHLPARIYELSKAGYEFTRTRRKDSTGQRYLRYSLAI